MQEMKIVSHKCPSCGDVKMITLQPDEKQEDLMGCVCDREVESSSKKKRHKLTNFSDFNESY